MDVQYREVKNVFQFQQGFMYVRLVTQKVPLAFVTFQTREDAQACKDCMHGCLLDDNSNIEFRAEFARQDKPPPPGVTVGQSRKRSMVDDNERRPKRIAAQGYNSKTIQITKLQKTTKQVEVRQLLSNLEGFKRMRWSPSKYPGGSPVAFADFDSDETTQQAMEQLKGQVIESCPDGIAVKLSELVTKRDFQSHRGPPSRRGSGAYEGYDGGGSLPFNQYSPYPGTHAPSDSYMAYYASLAAANPAANLAAAGMYGGSHHL